MDDLIRRQDAIDLIENNSRKWGDEYGISDVLCDLDDLPSAQPKISRIEQELHGKTPEEQYEFLHWLLLKFGLAYTDSRFAVVEWLKGEEK